MRASALTRLTVLLAVLVTSSTRAEEPCVRREPLPAPTAFLRGRIATFREYYALRGGACTEPEQGVDVEWKYAAAPDGPSVHTEHVLLRSEREGPSRIEARLFPSSVCDAKRAATPARKLAIIGAPGREKVAELVSVRVHVKATGVAAPLETLSPPVDLPCPACPSARGSARLDVTDDGRAITIDVSADREWFECARHDATLSLLVFSGDSEHAVMNAVKPELVVGDLEKGFVAHGTTFELHRVVPLAAICAARAAFVGFELWGHGELMAIGGGGRDVRGARCR